METHFLAKCFLYFSDTPASESYFLPSENVFLNEFSIPFGGYGFSVLWKLFFLINLFSTTGSRH